MSLILPSAESVARLERPGPRYTSYPTALEFSTSYGSSDYVSLLTGDPSGEPLSLYVHLPFCQQRCSFCGCNAIITRHDGVADKYLAYLLRELALIEQRVGKGRQLAQLHLGGGTPTYYQAGQLRSLVESIRQRFELSDAAELAVEVDPRVTSKEQISTLAELGFNRLSMGVQDFTPHVQQAIGREQSFECVEQLVKDARATGFRSGINLDIIYGLPLQTTESFRRSVEQTLALGPDRVAMYSFAYVPEIKGHQKVIPLNSLPQGRRKLELYAVAVELFSQAGYVPIGMDHFALPDDELARAAAAGCLGRNFMGYSINAGHELVALGISGISQLRRGYFQNERKLSSYYLALDAGRLPIERGYMLTDDDLVRGHVIQQLMCNFQLDKLNFARRFRCAFDDYFREELTHLEDDATVSPLFRNDEEVFQITHDGRLFVRNVCMGFDWHLQRRRQSAHCSKTV